MILNYIAYFTIQIIFSKYYINYLIIDRCVPCIVTFQRILSIWDEITYGGKSKLLTIICRWLEFYPSIKRALGQPGSLPSHQCQSQYILKCFPQPCQLMMIPLYLPTGLPTNQQFSIHLTYFLSIWSQAPHLSSLYAVDSSPPSPTHKVT